ncbi:hypothetical protein HA052_21595 [Chromobacterium haemolyticum]|uniref:Conjugal transfer protein TraN n=1 Tax=Chromobacterium fluminis TaxID=3044269 RepID=A0ABX0LFR5_9NEIS|nr:hypothetical protein [Chromobacterium haemolyticum]NHR07788.1 hypothetical protein [Chromobacterium haemolyticum]
MSLKLKVSYFLIAITSLSSQSTLADANADGQAFAKSLAPSSKNQVVNPSGVNSSAWTGATSIPTSTPADLGGFSKPTSGSSALSGAQAFGLSGLGNKAMDECANYIPGSGDAYKDQNCAAVNFLSNRCISPNQEQSKILGKTGVATASQPSCEGTFGQGQSKFDFNLKPTDSIFNSSSQAIKNAGLNPDTSCVVQTTQNTPAQYQSATCNKTRVTSGQQCSQYLNTNITITKTPGIPASICPSGTLKDGYCVSSQTDPAKETFVCPAGTQLVGYDCKLTNTTTSSAAVSFSCPSGANLSGTTCTSTNVVPAKPSYTCKNGDILKEIFTDHAEYTCIHITSTASTQGCPDIGIPFQEAFTNLMNNGMCYYARPYVGGLHSVPKQPVCPAGYTLSGATCSQSTTSSAIINGYTCPSGSQSGASCVITQSSNANITYSCPDGGQLSGQTCTKTIITTTPATPDYQCPTGAVLSGKNCISTETTPATITYSCVDGSDPISGVCFIRSVQTSWVNTCGAFERSAGSSLDTP